jgi:hypothetical protein
MSIDPGYDEPEYDDDYDPAWETQTTPFRQWLHQQLTAAGASCPADIAAAYAPANRYRGLSDDGVDTLAMLTGTSPDAVRAAHRADLEKWAREQQLRTHPDLAVLDADLDRIARRG